jgi:hypothetical protein
MVFVVHLLGEMAVEVDGVKLVDKEVKEKKFKGLHHKN